MICSAVKVAGVPGRGASAKTVASSWASAAASASAAAKAAAAAAHRPRHLATVRGTQPSWRASGPLRRPAAAPRMICTRSLIATFNIATGVVVAPALGPTRTEEDFAAHIAQVIATDPEASWLFLADNLNTHQSATLVRLVAERCGIADDLGVKGQAGLLRSQVTRACVGRLGYPFESSARLT